MSGGDRLFGAGSVSAFTLIEIMIVIAIIAIIAAVGLPPFIHAFQKKGIDKAVSDIMEGCSYARDHAILSGQPLALVIHASDNRVSVEGPASSAPPASASPAPVNLFPDLSDQEDHSTNGYSRTISDDIAIELLYVNLKDQMQTNVARVWFYPDGTSDEMTLVLMSKQQQRRKITVDPITGLADYDVIR